MPAGGKRPHSGPKKGTKYKGTISKEAAREALRQIVLTHMDALVASQIANAKGLSYLVTRDTKGKFIRVGAAMAGMAGEGTIEVWEKDPSVQAFTDLMNRALDKPKEQPQDVNITGQFNIVSRLQSARQRLLTARKEERD